MFYLDVNLYLSFGRAYNDGHPLPGGGELDDVEDLIDLLLAVEHPDGDALRLPRHKLEAVLGRYKATRKSSYLL